MKTLKVGLTDRQELPVEYYLYQGDGDKPVEIDILNFEKINQEIDENYRVNW